MLRPRGRRNRRSSAADQRTITSRADEIHARARLAIASCLSGGDSEPAWIAVWDLVQSVDREAKEDVLAMLAEYVDAAVGSRSASQEATNYFGSNENIVGTAVDRQWHKIELACDFEEVIRQSLRPLRLASPEVRALHRRDQIEAHEETLRKMGVQPGEGIPMWLMYMSRRKKKYG